MFLKKLKELRKIMKAAPIVWLILILAGISPSMSLARTWQVTKDGTGDFSVIQDAVDAAASGDEIQIGPGRFDDYTVINEHGTLYWDLYIFIEAKDLSFIGSGIGQTIVGPKDASVNEHDAYGLASVEGPSTITISGISFENINYQAVWFMYGHLEVDNCSFSNGLGGIIAEASEGGIVTNCEFNNLDDISVAALSPTSGFLVENCTFDTVYGGVGFWGVIPDCVVKNCVFDGGGTGRTAVLFSDGASGSVSNCTISDFIVYGIAFGGSGVVSCYDNVVEQYEGWGISLSGSEYLDFHDNIVSSNGGVIFLFIPGPMSFHNNHFFRGDNAWFVKTSEYHPYGPNIVDMTGNWWGTTDLNELAEWTYDGNDNDLVWIHVNYQPLADGPVSTESTTLEGIKAMYRDVTK